MLLGALGLRGMWFETAVLEFCAYGPTFGEVSAPNVTKVARSVGVSRHLFFKT